TPKCLCQDAAHRSECWTTSFAMEQVRDARSWARNGRKAGARPGTDAFRGLPRCRRLYRTSGRAFGLLDHEQLKGHAGHIAVVLQTPGTDRTVHADERDVEVAATGGDAAGGDEHLRRVRRHLRRI